MPRVSDICTDFAGRFHLEKPAIVGTARYLREAGLLSSGARGVNAPMATALDVSRLLIALMIGGKANNAAQAVQDFGTLIVDLDDGNSQRSPFAKSSTFEECFSKTIEYFGRDVGPAPLDSPIFQMGCSVSVIPHAAIASITLTQAGERHTFGFYPNDDRFGGGITDRHPTGLRVTAEVTDAELLAIGQILAGRKPIGWKWQDDAMFDGWREQAIEALRAANQADAQ